MVIHWVGIGDVKSAGKGAQLGSVLGSCVATVLWHPQQRFAVMNHILLPSQSLAKEHIEEDGRFAAQSWRMMKARLAHQGISLHECEAHVAGGANVNEGLEFEIGTKNTAVMLGLLNSAGIPLRTLHVGGTGHRNVRFYTETGEFRVIHSPTGARPTVVPTNRAA